jgi:hypothetical protein
MDYYKMSLEELDRLMVKDYKQEIEKLRKLIPTWTKFDRNDPKTFPTKNGNYLIVFYDEIRIAEWYDIYFIAEGSKPFNDCVFYWMPLPEMPNPKK